MQSAFVAPGGWGGGWFGCRCARLVGWVVVEEGGLVLWECFCWRLSEVDVVVDGVRACLQRRFGFCYRAARRFKLRKRAWSMQLTQDLLILLRRCNIESRRFQRDTAIEKLTGWKNVVVVDVDGKTH